MNANEPAYPMLDTDEHRQPYHVYPGLTKRELIAAMCLQGILANPDGEHLSGSTIDDAAKYIGIDAKDYKAAMHYPQVVAKTAKVYADALLTELAKEQT